MSTFTDLMDEVFPQIHVTDMPVFFYTKNSPQWLGKVPVGISSEQARPYVDTQLIMNSLSATFISQIEWNGRKAVVAHN